MTRQQSLHSLNLQALMESGVPLVESIPLHKMERLANECIGLQPESVVDLTSAAALRTGTNGQLDTWLQLQATANVPLTCQRCMGTLQMPLQIDRWYRFVESEDVAMAEDDASEEDLLVMAPQFDLLALLEDELLMALPLVPMHDECPVTPTFSAGMDEVLDGANEKPNPFAALAQLKNK